MSLREELVQVAAVAVAIIQDIDTGTADAASDYLGTVIGEVANERDRQDAQWGAQHHGVAEWLVILGEEYGEACKAALDETLFPQQEKA